jgi:hypothetical protein
VSELATDVSTFWSTRHPIVHQSIGTAARRDKGLVETHTADIMEMPVLGHRGLCADGPSCRYFLCEEILVTGGGALPGAGEPAMLALLEFAVRVLVASKFRMEGPQHLPLNCMPVRAKDVLTHSLLSQQGRQRNDSAAAF